MVRFKLGNVPETEQLEWHIALSVRSFSLYAQELDWLSERLPGLPDVEGRLAQIWNLGDPALAARVRTSSAAFERLEALLRLTRSEAPDALLAVALHVEDPQLGLSLLRDSRSRRLRSKDPFVGRSAQELDMLLDHSDTAGELPVQATMRTKELLFGAWMDNVSPPWVDFPMTRVEALADAVLALMSGSVKPLECDDASHGIGLQAGAEERSRLVLATQSGKGKRYMSIDSLAAALEGDALLSAAEQRRRLVRILAKATGHASGH